MSGTGPDPLPSTLAAFLRRAVQDPWVMDALCPEIGIPLFFPGRGGSYAVARAACALCPVAAPCLATALLRDGSDGMAGGLAPRQRQKLRAMGDDAVRAVVEMLQLRDQERRKNAPEAWNRMRDSA